MKGIALVLTLLLGTASATHMTQQNQQGIRDPKDYMMSESDINDENTSIQTLAHSKKRFEAESQPKKSGREERMIQIRNEINEREGSKRNRDLFNNINEKLQDKNFIEQAIENVKPTGAITNEARPNDLEVNTQELQHTDQSQHERNTDTMSEFNKDWEQEYDQGHHNTGQTNSAKLQAVPSLPHAWTKVGPSNNPKHLFSGQWQSAELSEGSSTGVSMAFLTVDSEEHATRFVKDLFKQGLVSQVQMLDGGFQRSYLKFGFPSTEIKRSRLEMVVSDGKIPALIDYINNNNPTLYDYPVPDVTVVPISTGENKYMDWARKQHKIDFHKIPYSEMNHV